MNDDDNSRPAAGKAVIVSAKGGEQLCAFGDDVLVKLAGAQTAGAFALIATTTQPGGGPPPHYHVNEDEMFIVQEGRVEFLVDGKWVEPGVGAVVYVPRGAVHTFRNAGDSPSRMWVFVTPSGFEQFFARCADEWTRGGGRADMQKIVGISAEHGIHFVK